MRCENERIKGDQKTREVFFFWLEGSIILSSYATDRANRFLCFFLFVCFCLAFVVAASDTKIEKKIEQQKRKNLNAHITLCLLDLNE